MKVEIPQIHWHGDRDRIMSIDFYPNSNILVTAGGESEEKHFIKIWEIGESDEDMKNSQPICSNENGSIKTKLKYSYYLTGAHNSVVNILRFSPDGKYLASAGDDQAIILWTLKKRPIEFGNSEEKILWSLNKLFRGHSGDIYDISWSPDSNHLISASVDNSAIIWNIEKNKGIICLKEHQHFVQGVSWDPRNDYVTTQSADKSVNFYSLIKATSDKVDLKVKNIGKIKQYTLYKKVEDSNDPDNKQYNKISNNFYANENQLPGFFRRLSWSPDGEFCLTVAGIYQNPDSEKVENVVWGFMRKDLTNPMFMLPTISPAICIRFCPIIFKKNKNSETTELIDLPYVLYFAIGTLDSVLIYSTQSTTPIYAITNIHVVQITDLAWNGSSMLCASSSDGYISFFHFENNNLGEKIDPNELPDNAKILYSQYLDVNYTKTLSKTDNQSNNISVQNLIKKQKKKENEEVIEVKEVIPKDNNILELKEVINNEDNQHKPKKRVIPTIINN